MRIFCPHCQEIFPVQGEAESVPCPHCSQTVDVPPSRVAPGVVLGDFLIEKLISSGGMGKVFVARQLSLDRQVALKVLLENHSSDSEYVQSLLHEARAAAKLNHPNIVQAYAVGEDDGIFYFAMEYIRGRTYKEILAEKKRLDPLEAAKVVLDVAKALDAAWKEQKIVHQDIKPENIMQDASGFAKLADLGLASRAGSTANGNGNEVMGTPQYISPEQLTGQPCDIRSDIYSLGATFYHFVTGRFPYPAKDTEEMGELHLKGDLTPPQELNSKIPDAVNDIIMKMMARNLEDRYQTPAELITALEDFINQQISESTMRIKIFRRKRRRKRSKREWFRLIRRILLLLALIGILGVLGALIAGNVIGKYQTGPKFAQSWGNRVHQRTSEIWQNIHAWAREKFTPAPPPATPPEPVPPPPSEVSSRPQLLDTADALLDRLHEGVAPERLFPRYTGLLKAYPVPITPEEEAKLRELLAAFAAAEEAGSFAPYRAQARARRDDLAAAATRNRQEAERQKQAEIARQKQAEAERQAEIARRKQQADQQAAQYARNALLQGGKLLAAFNAALQQGQPEVLNAALQVQLVPPAEPHPAANQAAAEYARLQQQLAELFPKSSDFIRQLNQLEKFNILVSLPKIGMAKAIIATADGKVEFRTLDGKRITLDRRENPREIAKLLTTLGKTLKTDQTGEVPAAFYYQLWFGEWNAESAPGDFLPGYLKKYQQLAK